MPITTDISSALTALAALPARVLRGAENGLNSIRLTIEEAMRDDPAHGDITGAAHASYFAASIGGNQDGQGVADAAYAVAAEHIANYTKNGLSGHGGQAARIDAPQLSEFERGLLFGSPVDYAEKLEQEGKAVVTPIFQQYAPAMRDSAAQGIRDELR